MFRLGRCAWWCCVVPLLVGLPAGLPADDWPSFLGPQHTGVSAEKGLLDTWPAGGPAVLWEKKIGTGYSAPSVRGRRLVVHHRPRHADVIDALDPTTGQALWSYTYPTEFKDPYGYNNGPRCSPLLTDKHCITFGADGRLLCLNLETGKKVWERETSKEWTVPEHFFGSGCSPVLEGLRVIVPIGGQPNSAVVAFDLETGKTVWEAGGKDVWDGAETDVRGKLYRWTGDEMLVSYSPPMPATIHGRRQVLCLLRQGLVSLDPVTGEVLYKYWFRSRTHESVNAARPIVIGDQVLLTAAYETGAALLTIRPDSQGYDVAWRKPRGLSCHWSTPIVVDGFAYGFSGRHEQGATLQCVDLATGDTAWETMGFDGDSSTLEQDPATGEIRRTGSTQAIPFPYFGRGSHTWADGKLICLGERGTLALVTPSPKGFAEISRCAFPQIRNPSWTAPVLANRRLYLRSETHLLCLDVAAKAAGN